MAVKSVTSADVARALGVSRSTVSRAFTENTYVRPELRDRILRYSKKMGYEPNRLAQALISRESPIVGIAIHSLTNPFHGEIYSELTGEMLRAGLTPLTAQLGDELDLDRVLSVFQQYRVRRVVLTSFAITEPVLDACLASGLEVYLLNRVDAEGRTAAICADLSQGGVLAADHIVRLGRRRIGIVDGVAGSWTALTRSQGYETGLRRHGLSPVWRYQGDYTYEAGVAAARCLVEGPSIHGLDALLCANDLMAFGVMDTLRAAGVTVPGDIGIVGFDDVPMASWGAYDLTSVRLPVRQMAQRLVQRLLEASRPGAEESETAPEVTFVPCRLIQRSTAGESGQ